MKPAGTGSKRTHKEVKSASDALLGRRTAEKYQKVVKAMWTGQLATEMAGEGSSRRRWLGRKRRPVAARRRISSMSRKTRTSSPWRLVDWDQPGSKEGPFINLTRYTRKNRMGRERVKANRGSGGVDGQTLEVFAEQLDKNLRRLQSELKEGLYQPQPVRQVQIPKVGKPGEFRGVAGIPTIMIRGAGYSSCPSPAAADL